MAKFCENCGVPLVPGSKFCTECGHPIPVREPAAAPPAPVPAPPVSAAPEPAPAVPEKTAPADGIQQPKPQIRIAKPKDSRQPVYHRQPQESSAPAKSKGSTGLAVFLSVLMLAEAAVAGFRYPGWFRKKENSEGTLSGNSQTNDADETPEVTADNSPGNPEFVELSFSESEYAAAKTLSASVSKENPTADFPEFGIHADLKSWNLENGTDTLMVKQMPTKTDPSTGAVCYTYDYSLASGQSKFLTDVEITVPIQGSAETLDNIITIDPETGKWKEVYYTVSDDGKSYTFSMNHFTPATEMSLRDVADKMDAFRYKDGKSIFCRLSREGAAKYQNTSHYLYNVGIIRTTDFEQMIQHDKLRAADVLEKILDGTIGSIPENSALAQGLSTIGDNVDIIGSFAKDLRDVTDALPGQTKSTNLLKGIGEVFDDSMSQLGTMLLLLRMGEQLERGVGLEKVIKDNAWDIAALIVEAAEGAAEGTALASSLSLIGLAIFIGARVSSQLEEEAKNAHFRNPRTIEEGAYQYFLTEYGKNVKPAPSFDIDNKAYAKIIGSTTAMADVASCVYESDVYGEGWEKYLNSFFIKYRKEPELLTGVIQAAYEFCVSRYWSQTPEVQEICWREALRRITEDGNVYDGSDFSSAQFGNAEKQGISKEEFKRRSNILYEMNVNHKSLDDIVAAWKADQSALSSKLRHSPDQAEIQAYKDKALAGLFEYTGPYLYEVYQSERKAAIMEIKDILRYEVLPFLNTRITFYWRDPAVQSGKIHENSLYYQFLTDKDAQRYTFAFDCDSSPLYLPGNDDSAEFRLFLQPNKDNNVLLETTIYNYLMWRCPGDILIFRSNEGKSDAELVQAVTDCTNVPLKADPNSCINGNGYVNIPSHLRNIKDIKVPVVPSSQQNGDLSQFFGTWQSREGDRQYRVAFSEKEGSDSVVDIEIELKKSPDNSYSRYTGYSLSRSVLGETYAFNGKTLLLSAKHYGGTVDAKNWKFRFSLKGSVLILEERLDPENPLLDSTQEIRSFELVRADADKTRNDLILTHDPVLCKIGSRLTLDDELKAKRVDGNTISISADGTVTVSIRRNELIYDAKSDLDEDASLVVTSVRDAMTFVGKMEKTGTSATGKLTSVPHPGSSKSVSGHKEGTSASVSGSNKLFDMDYGKCTFRVEFSAAGIIQSVHIFLVTKMSSVLNYPQDSGGPTEDIYTYDEVHPLTISLYAPEALGTSSLYTY